MDFLNRARRRLNGFASGVSQGLTEAARNWAEAALEEPPPPPMPAPRSYQRRINAGSFGSSHFCTYPELQASGLIAGERPGSGLYLGRYVEAYAPYVGQPPVPTWYGGERDLHLHYRGTTNIVTIAPAGAGKGTAAIIPTLLTCDESMFVLDLKGENWFVTKATRAQTQRIILINPFNIWGKQLDHPGRMTHRFNPLANLDPADDEFVPEINNLVSAMIVEEGKEPFFCQRAQQLVSCLIAYVCSPAQKARQNNTLPFVRELLGLPDNELAKLLAGIFKTSPIPLVRMNAGSFLDTIPAKKDTPETYALSKTNAAVRATAIAQLAFLEVDGIADFLSGNDFDFAQLRKEPMTIYCMIPPDKLDTYYRFARLMVQCFFNRMAQSPAATDRPVLALLDEQAKLRYMEIIETSVALLRGYKVRVWSIFQDINQIKSIYKDAWETFISNAGIIQVMTPNDATTAEYISKRIGNETITEYRSSTNTPARHPAAPQTGGSSGSGETVFGRPLLSPQDLYAMPETVTLILRQGNPNPIMATRECYYKTDSFYGIPYAPHPVHNREAFAVMKDTITRR